MQRKLGDWNLGDLEILKSNKEGVKGGGEEEFLASFGERSISSSG